MGHTYTGQTDADAYGAFNLIDEDDIVDKLKRAGTMPERIDELEDQVEALQRELLGTQEMLGRVLQVIGQPVLVTKELLAEPFPVGAQIRIDDTGDLDDTTDEWLSGFLFYIDYPTEEAEDVSGS